MSTIQIGGNTYNCREYIKSAGGQWQAASKTWSIDDAAWDKLVSAKPNLMSGCKVVGGTPAVDKDADRPFQTRKMSPVGPCRKCQSFCYGDCAA